MSERLPRACFSVLATPAGHQRLRGQRFDFLRERLYVGRSVDCDIQFRDPSVARRHAIIELTHGAWWIIDTLSTNGVLVNGKRVSKAQLSSNDHVQLGAREVIFFQGDIDELHAEFLSELVVRDAETGLYDQEFYLERLGRLVASATDQSSSLALITIEGYDELKGQLTSNVFSEYLRFTVDLITDHMGAGRLVARYDQNLFGVLFPNESSFEAERVCRALEYTMRRHAVEWIKYLTSGTSESPSGEAARALIMPKGLFLSLHIGVTNVDPRDRSEALPLSHERAVGLLVELKRSIQNQPRDILRVLRVDQLPPTPAESA
ncbi:MAG: FHA domain-containing protein [Polyangiaceae bacterium]